MRIELGKPGEFDPPRTPEEIIDRLEQRIGPKGRIIFENLVREVNRLQAEHWLETAGMARSGKSARCEAQSFGRQTPSN